jgi:hypothetical protein
MGVGGQCHALVPIVQEAAKDIKETQNVYKMHRNEELHKVVSSGWRHIICG